MRTKFIVYWLVGFVVIAAVVFWSSNYLIQQPIPKPPVIDLPSEGQASITDETDLPGLVNTFKTTRPDDVNKDSEASEGTAKEEAESVRKSFEESKPTSAKPTEKSANVDAALANELKEQEQKRERLNVIRDELKEMISGDPKKVDFAKLDQLLADLQSMGDANGTVGGVSITQLRKIVAQSSQIIQTSQSQGLKPGEDKNEKLKEEVKTLQELQSGIVVGQ